MLDCKKCSLCKTRSQVIPGKGKGRLFLVCDSPDKDDDLMGEPLSSNVGKHFNNLLSQSGWNDYYLTFSVKCLGAAKEQHVRTCREWLLEELGRESPSVVVAMGNQAICSLLALDRVKLDDYLGHSFPSPFCPRVYCWHSPRAIYRRGRKIDRDTISFFADLTHEQM